MTELIEFRIAIGLFIIILISVAVALLRGGTVGCVCVLCAGIVLGCAGYFMYCLGMTFYPPERNEFIMRHKPKCTDETIECMEARLRWYRDSVNYGITSTVVDTNRVKDSLKKELTKFKK